MQRIRKMTQGFFLLLFISLMVLGKAQIWMGMIFLSVLLAAFVGRFYCGWMCPMNTLIRPTRWLSQKLNMTKTEVPKVFRSRKPKYIAFGFFLVGISYTIYSTFQGKKFPLPVIIIPIALLVTFFINEKTWHTYFCPWGTLFSFTGRFSKYKVKSDACTSCSLCETNCPADAIIMDKNEGAVGEPANCLVCFECTTTCPTERLAYTKKEYSKQTNK